MINIPKNKRTRKKIEMVCKYEGCNKIFYGICVAKYCEEHRKEKYRKRRIKATDPYELNKVYKHKDIHSSVETWVCGLKGCCNTFEVRVYSNVDIYPKYCEEHRNEFKRDKYLSRVCPS